MLSKKNLLLALLLLVAGVFRFSYLDWGTPFFFHPDENNIANAIFQLTPNQLNPHFFAYGSIPMYTTYFFAFLLTFGKLTFPTIIYTLRFISALLSLLIIPSTYVIGKKMFSERIGSITALLSTFSVGYIQFAHFGTFEMWLTFFSLWFFYFCWKLSKKVSLKNIVIVGITFGILMGTKVSMLVLLPVPLSILVYCYIATKQKNTIVQCCFALLIFLLSSFFMYFFTNPYVLLDTHSFIQSLHYESSVALGTLPVFYTQSFLHTIPVVFQFVKIYPFLLNPIVELLFIPSFLVVFFAGFKKGNFPFLLLNSFFLILFFSQAFLFVKWTRYMVPTLPFMYLSVGIFIEIVLRKFSKNTTVLVFLILLIVTVTYSFSYMFTVFWRGDSRLVANAFAQKHFPMQQVLVEPYDLGALAFNATFPDAKIVNIYTLDSDPSVQVQLHQAVSADTIFISPSQRLMHSRLQNPTDFPQGYALYQGLLNGIAGFHVAYHTPCDIWCSLVYNGNPLTSEETASVFDHPIVTIFQK